MTLSFPITACVVVFLPFENQRRQDEFLRLITEMEIVLFFSFLRLALQPCMFGAVFVS